MGMLPTPILPISLSPYPQGLDVFEMFSVLLF